MESILESILFGLKWVGILILVLFLGAVVVQMVMEIIFATYFKTKTKYDLFNKLKKDQEEKNGKS